MSIKYFTWFMKSRNKIDTIKGVDEHEDFKSKQWEDKKNLYKVVDKLENRISTLEKVLESHANCIGAIRKICDE